MGPKRLSAEYESFYKEADKLFKEHDPCQFKEGSCARDWSRGKKYGYVPLHNGCCEGCRHLSPKGCTVKSLGCKLHMCGYIRDEYEEFSAELSRLRKEASETFPGVCTNSVYLGKGKFLEIQWLFTKRRREK